MKILVAVKRVIDPYVRVRVKSDGSGVETHNVKMAMNPFDEIALEEALRLREKHSGVEVVIVTISDNPVQDTLRHGLALGADRAILIHTDRSYCSLNIAKILQKVVTDESPDLIFMGKQSIDGDNNQTPQMLAGLLDWPQATYASHVSITDESVVVNRETDTGLEELRVHMPAVVSVDLRLNEPRYASLPNIMKAKQKPLTVIELNSLGLVLAEHRRILKVTNPATRSAGIKVDSVQSLLDKLQQEAKVL
ncbi:MAG: electron transfer flavoprotein subunit beta/FixA family protein [Legionellaceae bacterium]|nr:electron transfer flavoprotein subunit beta/FixA family protein [Legionellaceae bacterium]